MPCPRCFILKDDIFKFGSRADMRHRENTRIYDGAREHAMESARRHIYERGYAVGGDAIDGILGTKCIVPTRVSLQLNPLFIRPNKSWLFQNAFTNKLSKFGLDHHQMFVVDLLHEFELGVWKASFTHLLRILYAAGGDLLQEVNERYDHLSTIFISVFSSYLYIDTVPSKRSVEIPSASSILMHPV
jgi:hypothetical protein